MNNILKVFFTDWLVRTFVSRPISSLMDPIRSQCVPVFMLHRMENKSLGIRGHSAEHIKAALTFLKDNKYTVVSLRKIFNHLQKGERLPKRAVAFTIDDGFYEQAEIALPIFESFDAPVTLFIATDLPDLQAWSWDFKVEYIINSTQLSEFSLKIKGSTFYAELKNIEDKKKLVNSIRNHLKDIPYEITIEAVTELAEYAGVKVPCKPPEAYKPMTWEQAIKLESKNVEFGPHSCRHTILSQLPFDVAKLEISNSWSRLKEKLEHPVPCFCYPTGRDGLDYGEREKKFVCEVGLKFGLSAEPGYIDLEQLENNDLLSLKRFSFPNNLTDFKQYCSWIERAKYLLFNR